MRIVKRQELMDLPEGTLFAEMLQPWVFGQLSIKGESFGWDGRNQDFFELGLAWVDGSGTEECVARLDEMLADSTVSYPAESAYGREGLFDDDRAYLVYEKADVDHLIRLLAGVDGGDLQVSEETPVSDQLVWKSRNPEHFAAESLTGAAHYYVYIEPFTNELVAIYAHDDELINGPSRKTLYRGLDRDFDNAKRIAQNHQDAACRADRWRIYMRDNEPPVEEGLA